ncbi:hypothetical protein NLM33_19025 [Bradyrhizobium sp. CCGUVB1N3]|uniref:hypothetical protein n=1 Tax=Bradyrhizobium sp. CCGUVB1N3 TaxID=2949629 RepID=UPI0020B19783|nr:hypothetical protein [Bradyrhizobium sp. CCGUVB1N3]MCP3472408.1 hypothetical protein [Bradyrhizobium sp. CCGUVB1N3]
MTDKKMTAEEFVRRVLVQSFKQRVDKDTLKEVAKKVKEAVPAKQRPSRAREAA